MSEMLNEGSAANVRYWRLLEKLGEYDWASFGSVDTNGNVGDVHVAPKKLLDFFSTDEFAVRLGLIDENGETQSGYVVSSDEDSGQTIIEYNGPYDNDYAMTLQFMRILSEPIDGIEPLRAFVRNDPDALVAYWSERYADNLVNLEAPRS